MSYQPCELHCHTIHSDGSFTPKQLQRNAVEQGYSLIALTDHNAFSAWDEADNDIIPFIKGIEWTTYFGHMLVLGSEKYIDWRTAVPDNIDEKTEALKKANAVIGVAHPFQLGSPMCTGGRWEFNVKKWENINYIEIWHENFTPESYENSAALKFWTVLLDRGFHIAAAYGRDWHRNYDNMHFGCTYLGLNSNTNETNALQAIKNGNTVVSTGAKFFMLAKQNGAVYEIGSIINSGKTSFEFYTDEYARHGFEKAEIEYEHIRLVTNGNKTVFECDITKSRIEISLKPSSWYRAELWGSFNKKKTLLAVTSPIYTKQ